MRADELFREFIDWGYKAPPPAYAVSMRRKVRERVEAKIRAAIYAETPSFPDSRQVKRRRALLTAKAKR